MAAPAVRKVLDVYDEEFATNMEIAKNLVAMVQNPKGNNKFIIKEIWTMILPKIMC